MKAGSCPSEGLDTDSRVETVSESPRPIPAPNDAVLTIVAQTEIIGRFVPLGIIGLLCVVPTLTSLFQGRIGMALLNAKLGLSSPVLSFASSTSWFAKRGNPHSRSARRSQRRYALCRVHLLNDCCSCRVIQRIEGQAIFVRQRVSLTPGGYKEGDRHRRKNLTSGHTGALVGSGEVKRCSLSPTRWFRASVWS